MKLIDVKEVEPLERRKEFGKVSAVAMDLLKVGARLNAVDKNLVPKGTVKINVWT